MYESKSILNVSKKLYSSQPAVSNSIKKLETFLNGKLFIRTSKGVIPTTEGEQFNNYCYNAMKIIENGINTFSFFSNLNVGTLNIGSSSTIIRKLLLSYISEFSKQYPGVNISITDANSSKLIRLVKRGEVDLAILNTPVEDAEPFTTTNLTTTSDCFIAPTNFNKNHLTLDELKQENLILEKRPSNNRDFFEDLCVKNNILLKPNYEIGSFGLITDFVEKGMGIPFTVSDFISDDIKKWRVKIISTELKAPKRSVVAITLKNTTNSFACETFINNMVNYFKKT